MRFPVILLLGGILVVPALHAENATISGYVTRVASHSDFDVNGVRIRCGNQTYSEVVNAGRALGMTGCPQSTPYVGQKATVMGKFDKHDSSLVAGKIDLTEESGSSGAEIPLPRRSAYVYKILGECWNNPAAVADRN